MTAIGLGLGEGEFEVDKYQAFYEMVKKWTVSDYRTQGIKAEVILDMLLSKYLEEIVALGLAYPCGSVKLLAKEIPLNIKNQNLNAKVDYLAYAENTHTLFLVELKTTVESYKNTQFERMQQVVDAGVSSFLNFFLNEIVQKKVENTDDAGATPTKKYLYTLWHMTDKLGIEADAEAFSYIGDSRHDKIALHEKELARDQQIAEVKKVAAKINEELGNAKMTALYVTLNKIEKLPNQYHQIILKEIYDDERFFYLLKESNKYEEWGLMKDILKELLVPPDKWFHIGCKSDIVN